MLWTIHAFVYLSKKVPRDIRRMGYSRPWSQVTCSSALIDNYFLLSRVFYERTYPGYVPILMKFPTLMGSDTNTDGFLWWMLLGVHEKSISRNKVTVDTVFPVGWKHN